MSIDPNSPAFQEAKKKAIAFYDVEHTLDDKQRSDLHVFFEEVFRRTLLLSSVGLTVGVAFPIVTRKKGVILNPVFPIMYGMAGMAVVPMTLAEPMYKRRLTQLQAQYGEGSQVDQVVQATPGPIARSWFWSNYFKMSISSPQRRIRDPRTNTLGIPTQPARNGIPGFEGDNKTEPDSAWNKIRGVEEEKQEEKTKEQGVYEVNNTSPSGLYSDTPSSILPPQSPLDYDPSKGSAWERIRSQNK